MGVSDISLASFKCAAIQASLPLPKSSEENDHYFIKFKKMLESAGRGLSTGNVALDLNDINREGLFKTSTGKRVDWYKWTQGEPNNKNGVEHYAFMYINRPTGKWNDAHATWKVDVFCEMAADVPTFHNPWAPK